MRRTLLYGIGVAALASCLSEGEARVRWQELLSALDEKAAEAPLDRAVSRSVDQARRSPGDEGAWMGLGEALVRRAREAADAEDPGRAEAAFRRALELDRESAAAMSGLGSVALLRRQLEPAREWAERAIAEDPDHAPAHGVLGDAALEAGDYRAASEHYQKMMDLRPDLSSYSRGAQLVFLRGDVRKATWLLQKAIREGASDSRENASARARLALMLWSTGALLPAEQLLETALEDAPQDPDVLAAMARVKASRNDFPAAVELYKKAIETAPRPETIALLGDLYLSAGKTDEAEEQFARVEAIHRRNQELGAANLLQMARFYADHDRSLEQALAMAEAEYQARPNVFAADTLAWCYYKNRRLDDARRILKKSLTLGDPDADLLFHAGMIFGESGDRVEAQKHLYKALSLNPSFHPLDARVASETLQKLGSAGVPPEVGPRE